MIAEDYAKEFRASGPDPPVRVRRLNPGDARAYRSLMLEAYASAPEAFTSTVSEREPLSLKWWKSRVSDTEDAESLTYGAFIEDELVGAVGLHLEQRDRTRHKATLYGTFVRQSCRRRGIARRLVEAVMNHARVTPQIRQVVLRVTTSNQPALRLYEAFGFLPFGTEPDANRVGDRFIAVTSMWCPVKPTTPMTRPRPGAADSVS